MAVALLQMLGRITVRVLVCLAGMNIEEFIQAIVTERQPGNVFASQSAYPTNQYIESVPDHEAIHNLREAAAKFTVPTMR